MKRSELLTLSYGFIYMFIGSMLFDFTIIAFVSLFLAIVSIAIIFASFKEVKLTPVTDTILFLVQSILIFVLGNKETALSLYLVTIFNTLVYEVLKNMPKCQSSKAHKTLWYLFSFTLVILLITNGVVANLLNVNGARVMNYVPLLTISFTPLITYTLTTFKKPSFVKKEMALEKKTA